MLLEAEFAVLHWIQANLRCPVLDWLMPRFTLLGELGAVWVLLALVFLARPQWRRRGVTLAIGLICSAVLGNLLLKNLIARPRPCWLEPEVELLLAMPRDYSFPSGHSLSGFIAAVITLRYSRGLGIPALILAAALAFSRLYLFVHFPTDVLAGVLLGIGVGLGVWYLCENVLFRRYRREYL